MNGEQGAADDGSEGSGPPWSISDAVSWLLFAIAGFAVGQVLGYVILVVVATLNGHTADYARLAAQAVPPAWVVVSELVGLWIGFLGAIAAAVTFRGTGSVVNDLGLRFSWWDLLIGPVVGFVGQVVLIPILYLPLYHLNPHIQHELSQPAQRLTGGFHGGNLFIIGFLTVVVVPLIEEMLFRGVLLRSFLRLFRSAGRFLGPAFAIILTGVLFGLAHFEPVQLLGLCAFGVVLSWLAYKLRRLGAGILAHATFNLIAVLAIASSSAVH
ncbi:MAG TPA: type II CAAX endopeptidase family protein [Acidimicrobiales bacterium]|nr:type II CAAX endopeptidase family protein [Acidimicrobiales bacterium]